jgi:glycosyltransferase involved in cell wall biosynthesis
MQQQVRHDCEVREFDLVQCEWIPYASYETYGIPRLIVAHNVESEIWRRRADHDGGLIGSWFFGLQARRMKAFERQVSSAGAHVVTVSQLDAETFRSYGAHNVTIVPNGVDLAYFRPMPQVPQTDSLVFIGSLDWYANEDAVKNFAMRALPVIRNRNPKVTLRVIGRRPSPQLAACLRGLQGVELIGEVSDVRPYLASARAVVVPLRIGGGTRIKILEALAMGKPVISTSIGAEGLDIKEQRDFLIANNTEEFAARIDELFARPEEQMRLGLNGRSVVEKLYGWDAAAEKLEHAWNITAARCNVPSAMVTSWA